MAPQIDLGSSAHSFRNARLHIPVAVVAGYIDRAYPGGKDTHLEALSGEFLRLSFTPNDAGGKLYSIVRRRVYFTGEAHAQVDAASGISFPRVADLESSIFEKYGRPGKAATAVDRGSFWIYDVRGRSLPADHRDFSRCASAIGELSYNGTICPLCYRGVTLRALEDAIDNKELASSKHTRGPSPDSIVNDLDNFVPTSEHLASEAFRDCGTQLFVSIDRGQDPSGQNEFATAMTVSLSDQNALLFDNGVTAYMKAQVAKTQLAPSSPAKKETF
jgi:hypothetical protein